MGEPTNKKLRKAKKAKMDEFYTRMEDIEAELSYYTKFFRDKVVYCNADDPRSSNFFRYFVKNFKKLGLKKLITTCYKDKKLELFSKKGLERAIATEYTGTGRVRFITLRGDGDFRSEEAIRYLKEADIVVTNPPFSLFREYVNQLIKYEKKFLIMGNINAITYKEISPLIIDNKMWLGVSITGGDREFRVPDSYLLRASGWRIDKNGRKFVRVTVRWFTNLDHGMQHKPISLATMEENIKFNSKLRKKEGVYKRYNNYNAIEVPYTDAIPSDYEGVMGVPISFANKYNPEQFEIINICDPILNGKNLFKRILIKHKKGGQK